MSRPMEGRVCLITGGSSGVGLAVARGLAMQGASLVLLCRDRERGMKAKERLSVETGNPRIGLIPADLSEEASVRAAASSLLKVHERLHVVACCAGVLCPQRRTNSKGVELTLASEVLGHYLLVSLLLERLEASAPARVVVAAGGPGPLRHRPIDFDDLQLSRRYSPVRAKLQAALAKVLFAMELARRAAGTGVTANVFHPGLVRSNLTRNLPGVLRAPAQMAMGFLGRQSRAGVRAASSPELDGVSGRYLVGRNAVAFPDRLDDARRLWDVLESLAGSV